MGPAHKTGDIVELLADGNLLYHGRRDDQVKVNGFRVELGEIQTLALAVSGVVDAVFEIVQAEMAQIEGYVVLADEHGGDAALQALWTALADALPKPARPRRITVVPTIELNTHGKRDVAATRRRWDGATPRR